MNNKKGLGLIDMLMILLIVIVIVFVVVKLVRKNPGVSQQPNKALSDIGIEQGSAQDIIQQARESIKGLNKDTDKTQK